MCHLNVCMCTTIMQEAEGLRFPGTGVTDVPIQLNMGSLEEQAVCALQLLSSYC